MYTCYLDSFIIHPKSVVEQHLSKYQKINYNKFMWWRTHAEKTTPLGKRAPLIDRIDNGDFEFPSFFWQAQYVLINAKEKLNLKRDTYKDQYDKTQLDFVRYKKLIEDFNKEENKRLEEFEKAFTTAFNLTKDELYDKLTDWEGDTRSFYNYLRIAHPFSPCENRKRMRSQDKSQTKVQKSKPTTGPQVKRKRGRPKKNTLFGLDI